MIDLNGKRAMVTGACRGIGAAIALALAENGADVAFTYQSSAKKAATMAKSIERTGRRAVAIQADSAAPEAIMRSVSEAVSALGGLDILVDSAAIGHTGAIADIDVNDYQAVMDVNVRAPVLFAKAVIPHLSERGRIITISSALGERVPFPGITAYAMSRRHLPPSRAVFRANSARTASPSILCSPGRPIRIQIRRMARLPISSKA